MDKGKMDKDKIRTYIFSLLRDRDEAPNFDYIHKEVDQYLCRETGTSLGNIGLMEETSEVIWELLVQGVLAPGNKCPRPGNPQADTGFKGLVLHKTEYGKRCLEKGEILPHDPHDYLKRLEESIKPQELDSVVRDYVTESLETFLSGNCMASTVMLGVAAEQCIYLLASALTESIKDPPSRKRFEKKLKGAHNISQLFEIVRRRLNSSSIELPGDLKDALPIQLCAVFTLIRYSRNDAGHPFATKTDKDTAFDCLYVFHGFCRRVYALLEHLV